MRGYGLVLDSCVLVVRWGFLTLRVQHIYSVLDSVQAGGSVDREPGPPRGAICARSYV